MSLAKRQLEIIADTLFSTKPQPHWDANKMAQWVVTVNAFAEAGARYNPKFKRERFLDACGYN